MKWFQLDSNTPNDPKMRTIRKRLGKGAFGSLVMLWCFVAEHGSKPGVATDKGTGRPYTDRELADASELTTDQLHKLLTLCAEIGHIDAALWATHKTLRFPAMERRTDEVTRKKAREERKASVSNPDLFRNDSGISPATTQHTTSPHQNNTGQDGGDRPSQAELEKWFTDQFWPAYPPKGRDGRPVAFKALQKLNPTRAMLVDIMAGLDRWNRSQRWADEYICGAAVFFNQQRFNDHPPEAKPKTAAPPPPQSGRTGAAPPGKYAHLMRRPQEIH